LNPAFGDCITIYHNVTSQNRNFKNIQGVLEQVSSNALLQTFDESRYELRPHAERTFIDKLIEQVNRENYALSVPFLILAADELALSGRCPRQEAMDKLFFQLKVSFDRPMTHSVYCAL
jgi:hypothetical protein